MNESLRHRGPDHSAIFSDGPITLGHTRLSIIDLSESANQPLSDHSGRFHIVFNGEIYNFRQLRRQLQTIGARFRTQSDTEVILEAYKTWGADCLERLNGMFAFAIWDTKESKLFLARDRLGKKPLFYYPLSDGGILFASELKALMLDPCAPKHLCPEALSQYLSINYTLTSKCIIKGVKKLEPGHFLKICRGASIRPICYWNLAECFHNKTLYNSLDEAAEDFLSIFEDSVRIRMVSDVPLGAFLSGGLDSSAITSAMRQQHPTDLKTFSIGFNEDGYSELEYAKLAADHLGVKLHEMVVSADMTRDLQSIVTAADEPFADTSMIPMYYLAEFAKKHVTVALSGDGCDELFAGYKTYSADRLRNMLQWIPPWFFRSMHKAVSALPGDYGKVSLNFKLRQFLKGAADSPGKAHYRWRELADSNRVRQLLPQDLHWAIDAGAPYSDFSSFEQDVATCHYLDRAMYVDIKTWLADDILVKVDRMTMAHSLEARAPFLDYRLVEYAARLPVEYKMKFLEGKLVVRKAMTNVLPSKTISRKKAGFNSPVSHWLTRSMGSFVGGIDEPFNISFVQHLYDRHLQKKEDNGMTLLALINFTLWKNNQDSLSIT